MAALLSGAEVARRWVLSPQCQVTLQLSSSLVLSSLFVLIRPLHFSHACLVPVFVLVIVGSLATDQHIGTRLQVSAWVLGPTWLAAILAGGLMSLAKLAAPGSAASLALTAALAVLGLGLLIFLQAVSPPGPGRVMGVLAVLLFGIIVLLSLLYPDIRSMWLNAVLLVVLGMAVAAAVAILVGFLVAPSLASDEVWRLTSEALQGAGAVLSYHTSLLMVDTPAGFGQLDSRDSCHEKQQQQQAPAHQRAPAQQQHVRFAVEQAQHPVTRSQPRRSSIDIAAAGAALVAASQEAFKPASQAAAAAALSWVDAADTAASSVGAADHASSAGSEHSSAATTATASLVGSDAVADAAAELLSKRGPPQLQQQGAAAHAARLSEQLLQQQQQLGAPQPLGALPAGGAVDAWVSAAAAAAAARASEDGSAVTDLSVGSSALQANMQQQQQQPHRRSLEGAASLVFQEELTDAAFLQQMRVLSQSKGSVSLSRPAPSKGQLPHVKSTGSALSALSVAGSAAAGADWTRAVPAPSMARPSVFSLPSSQQHHQHPPAAAASVAESVVSSHVSVLQQPQQRMRPPQQHTRLGSQRQQQQQQQSDQQPRAAASRRPVWSFLTRGARGVRSEASLPPPSTAHAADKQQQQQQQQQDKPASTLRVDADAGSVAGDAAPHVATAGPAPPLLAPPTTSAQLQPLVGRAKAALASARLEPWWLRPKGLRHFDADACMRLLDNVELLLVRLSVLEGVSEERSVTGLQLHRLAHYRSIADALALILAQLTAFIANVAAEVGQRDTTCNWGHPAGAWWPAWLRLPLLSQGKPAAGAARQHGQHQHQQQHQQQPGASTKSSAAAGAAARAAPPPQQQQQRQRQRQRQRPSPFAAAVTGEVGGGAEADAASMGLSTLLSGMERQGSGVSSSYLWQRKTGWGQARDMLRREMDASLGSYWWAVSKASKQSPVKVPRSREVMLLTFLWPICNGVLEACERIETSAQQVLRHSSPAASSSTPHQQQRQHNTPPAAAAGSCMAWLQARVAAARRWQQQQAQWAHPLLQLVLVKPSLLAVYNAVTQELPATLSSWQGVRDLLGSRNFQAAVKLLVATVSVLLGTMLLMAYVPVAAHSLPIFGFAAVVLCSQPRVEATVEQAARRVVGTVLGATLGLATNSIPGIFQEPLLLAACLAVASIVLGVLARPQRRSAIVLALLTLCAVSLCGFEAVCCSPRGGMSPVDTFLARMTSVVGACVYVALLNRLLLPWFTSDYALEQLADALQQSALLFQRVYESQLERMRLAEQVALQVSVVTTGAPPQPPSPSAPAAADDASVQLAAAEAAEAQLLVVLRQQVLSRLVAVQLSLAKESVSWAHGVLATPPLVLNVVAAMTAIKEALASQRLALAPFTKAAGGVGGSGMLHTMVHCYSMWALPLHPLWLEIVRAVHELTACTAAHLRRQPRTRAARAAASQELAAKLQQLEARRLDLRHAWLDTRKRLHRAVHDGQPWVMRGGSGSADAAAAAGGGSFWPTDSIHLFTFTYGVSRCLNAFAAAARAVAAALEVED